jgi:hypothetical protein
MGIIHTCLSPISIECQFHTHLLCITFLLSLGKRICHILDIFHSSIKSEFFDRMCQRYILCSRDVHQKLVLDRYNFHKLRTFHLYLKYQLNGHTRQIYSSCHRCLDNSEMHKPHIYLLGVNVLFRACINRRYILDR